MKKILFVFIMVITWSNCFSQGANKQYEKIADKYSVKTITVLDRTFNVGDTIQLLSGSGTNGEFLSVRLLAGSTDPFPANGTGRKFIILKIYHSNDGLNTFDQLVCSFTDKFHIYIDPTLGLTRKEF